MKHVDPLVVEAAEVVRCHGAAWLGLEGAQVSDIGVVRNGTAFMCKLVVENRDYRLVLKQSKTAEETESLVNLVRELARFGVSDLFPWVPGHSGRWYAMEHVGGGDLLAQMRRHSTRLRDALDNTIEATAAGLARVHSLPARELGLPALPYGNEEFARRLRRIWIDAGFQRLLPREFQGAECVTDRLPWRVLSRNVQQLQLIDARGKNTVVTTPTNIRFVDLAFASGNPAQGVAVFLVALDRFLLREALHPFAWRTVSRWQRLFVSAYAAEAPASVVEDLLLFYPWVLAAMCVDHCRDRSRQRLFLSRFYAIRAARYLKRWVREAGDVAGFFADDPIESDTRGTSA